MPYNPGTQYRGDVHLARGIEDAGRGLAGAIQNFRRDKAESDFLDEQVVSLATAAKPFVESGEMDASLVEELSKFPGQSLTKKRGIAARALFEVQNARATRQERVETEDRNLRRNREGARLAMEQERFGAEKAERGRLTAGRDRFNAELSRWMGSQMGPKTMREAAVGLAAESGLATPEMLGGLDDARLRDMEMNIRDRAVGVQERNAGVAEGKLDLTEEGADQLKPGERERLINAILLRLSDPLRPPDEATDRMLRDRLKTLEGNGKTPGAAGPSETDQTGGTKRVAVISPDGRRGTIPEAQLPDALKKGFKRAGD